MATRQQEPEPERDRNRARVGRSIDLRISGGSACRVAPATEPMGRGLLVLDGNSVSPDVQRAAHACCAQLVDRVDILLVNSPRAPISLLHELLVALERANIDYRLTSTSGGLVDQVLSYLKRFLGITTIIVEAPSNLARELEPEWVQRLPKGYQLITLGGPSAAY